MPKNARLRPANDFPKLHFLIEQRAATIPLLHRTCFAHCRSETSVNEWLRRMRALRLVEDALQCITPRGHIAVRASAAAHALGLPGSDYSAAPGSFSHVTLPHTLAVAEIAATYRPSASKVYSERFLEHQRQELRHRLGGRYPASGAPSTPWATRREGGRGLHLPDLIIEQRQGARIAVEVELHPKDERHYEDLFRGFWEAIGQGHINGVWYFLPTRGSSISSAAMRQRIYAGADAARLRASTASGLWTAFPWTASVRTEAYVWVLDHEFLYDTKV